MARTLEIQRHTFTKKGSARDGGTAISQEGVDLARRVGAGLGPFHLVVVSDIPRTLETAVAMGFAVDAIDVGLSAHDAAIHQQVAEFGAGKRLPFATWARLVDQQGPVGDHARCQKQGWLAIVSRTPEGASALVISHGGTIEALEVVDGAEPLSERQLRAVAHAGAWPQQRAAWRCGPPP